jgi:hypothetical protein
VHASAQLRTRVYRGVFDDFSIDYRSRNCRIRWNCIHIVVGIGATCVSCWGPIVDVTWTHFDDKQELMLIVTNKGRADVTVFDIDLSIVRHRITRQLGRAFDLEMTFLSHIARKRWCASQKISFPVRLPSNSMFSVNVKRAGIDPLPSEIPLDEILFGVHGNNPSRSAKSLGTGYYPRVFPCVKSRSARHSWKRVESRKVKLNVLSCLRIAISA